MKALITGATSGIGKSIAENLHRRGWKLILTGRNERVLNEMKERFGNGTEIIVAELSKREDVFQSLRLLQGKESQYACKQCRIRNFR